MRHDTIPTETHQGFNLISLDDEPSGLVLLVERQAAHDRFHQEHPCQLTVLLRITDVKTLVNKGETAASYFDADTTVITTTTVNDRILAELDWNEELELIKQFQPDFHIPCDYPVYKEDDPDRRREHVWACLKGMLWMAETLAGTKTRIIPLLKGETPAERRLCYQVFQYYGVRYCVFYGTQYFTGNLGFYQLLEDLRAVVSEAPHLRILLIGLQAPHRLEQMPPQIVAAAGQRWIDTVRLRKVSTDRSQERYRQMEQKVNTALGDGQMPIMAWAGGQEVTA